MSKRQKALERYRNNPRNVRFDELAAQLEHLGFVRRQEGTSHAVFTHPKWSNRLTIPFRKPFLKSVYVLQALEAIDEVLQLLAEEEEKEEIKDDMDVRSVEDYLKLPYTIEVIRDDDPDNPGWVARVVELPGCLTQADNFDELEDMIKDAMRAWITVGLEDELPIPEPRPPEEYSGKFLVRLPKSLHRELVETAEREGVSLNQFVASQLAKAVGAAGGRFGSE